MGLIHAKSYIHARSILYVLLHILIKLIRAQYIENNKPVAHYLHIRNFLSYIYYLHIRKLKARLENLVNSEFILILFK
jgi:hypothetical protein